MCVCVSVCVRACVRACVRVCLQCGVIHHIKMPFAIQLVFSLDSTVDKINVIKTLNEIQYKHFTSNTA